MTCTATHVTNIRINVYSWRAELKEDVYEIYSDELSTYNNQIKWHGVLAFCNKQAAIVCDFCEKVHT